MAKKPTKIFFLTWPDGRMFEGTQTSTSEDIAIGRAIRTWLIPDHFPGLELGARYYGPMEALWRSMQQAGFRVHSIDVADVDGVSA